MVEEIQGSKIGGDDARPESKERGQATFARGTGNV